MEWFRNSKFIIFQGDKIHGLTTAAALWTTAAIGVAVGFSLYAEALFTVLLILFIMRILAYAERRIPHADFEK